MVKIPHHLSRTTAREVMVIHHPTILHVSPWHTPLEISRVHNGMPFYTSVLERLPSSMLSKNRFNGSEPQAQRVMKRERARKRW